MPVFDYKCPKCDDFSADVLVNKSDDVVRCFNCDTPMIKDYSDSRVMVVGDIPEHYNESLGMWIKSRKDLREKLWLTNSRTDDIVPSGGLTREERAILRGECPNTKIIKPTDPLPDGTIELEPVDID